MLNTKHSFVNFTFKRQLKKREQLENFDPTKAEKLSDFKVLVANLKIEQISNVKVKRIKLAITYNSQFDRFLAIVSSPIFGIRTIVY